MPSDDLLHGDLVGLTPMTLPGATTIRTTELELLLAERNPLVVDTMLYSWGHSIPGAVGLPGSGRGGELSSPMTERLGASCMRYEATCRRRLLRWADFRALRGRNWRCEWPHSGTRKSTVPPVSREAWEVAGCPKQTWLSRFGTRTRGGLQ